jgi:dienelactone hydrolase
MHTIVLAFSGVLASVPVRAALAACLAAGGALAADPAATTSAPGPAIPPSAAQPATATSGAPDAADHGAFDPGEALLAAAPVAAHDYDAGPVLPTRTFAGLKLHDVHRDVILDATVHYPVGPGPFPVIVFSHGLGGSKDGYAYLGNAWAAHGYIAIHPTHPGSDSSLFRVGGGVAGIVAAMRDAMVSPAIWIARPHDITSVIDCLPQVEQQVPDLAGRIDAQRVGVAGHSYGAYTTLAVAGLGPGGELSLADPRPLAFIAMSPQGPTRPDDNPFAHIARPMLIMTGSEDNQPPFLDTPGGPKKDGAWRAQSYALLPPGDPGAGTGDKALLFISGASHFTFSGGAGAVLLGHANPTRPVHLRIIVSTSLAWWDAHLKPERAEAAKAWLAGGPAPAYGADLVRWERK